MPIKIKQPVLLTTFLIVLLLSLYRSPYLFLHGRFWAEEGSVFFAQAVKNGFWESLFYVYQRTGYYLFFTNLIAALAASVPLSIAPYITTYAAFGVFIVVLLIISLPSFLLRTEISRAVAMLMLLVLPTHSPEVWLNTINAQVYFAIGTLLALFIDFRALGKKQTIGVFAFVFVAAFSSVYGAPLLPVFVLQAVGKWLIDKQDALNGKRIMLTALIFAATLLQAGIAITTKISGTLANTKLRKVPWEEMIVNSATHIWGPCIVGTKDILLETSTVTHLFEFHLFIVAIILAGVVLFFGVRAYKQLAAPRLLTFFTSPLFLLFMAHVVWVVFVNIGAHGLPAGRYAVATGFSFGLLFLYMTFAKGAAPSLRVISCFILLTSLTMGAFEFVRDRDSHMLSCVNNSCPIWEEEIQHYDQNKRYMLKIWPYEPGWRLKLSR